MASATVRSYVLVRMNVSQFTYKHFPFKAENRQLLAATCLVTQGEDTENDWASGYGIPQGDQNRWLEFRVDED